MWIEYDHTTANKLERAFKRNIKKSKLDSERYSSITISYFSEANYCLCRYIDMSDKKHIMQRRYSDPDLARYVKREEHAVSSTPKVALVLMS